MMIDFGIIDDEVIDLLVNVDVSGFGFFIFEELEMELGIDFDWFEEI